MARLDGDLHGENGGEVSGGGRERVRRPAARRRRWRREVSAARASAWSGRVVGRCLYCAARVSAARARGSHAEMARWQAGPAREAAADRWVPCVSDFLK
jgi:hypothetical protein